MEHPPIFDEADYVNNKRPDHTYVSRSFPSGSDQDSARSMRYISIVLESDIIESVDLLASEFVIRRTPGGKQEVKALVYEDDRSVAKLSFQRYTTGTGVPHKGTSFTFVGDEIDRVLDLMTSIRRLNLEDGSKSRIPDSEIEAHFQIEGHLLKFLEANRERLGQIESLENFSRYLTYCERERQLKVFERLLDDNDFFEAQMRLEGLKSKETLWQKYFEKNPWIFGLGLAPIFLSSVEDKLEQIVSGYSVAKPGKRADALMRTNGVLSALCFVEIKTHHTPLLRNAAYRSGSYSVTDEVAGAIAQCHATVQLAMKEFGTLLRTNDENGNPTGTEAFLYQPRSFLVVGSLRNFDTALGANEEKFRSFELFRRNLSTPELITFDELYERAKASLHVPSTQPEEFGDDGVPF